MAKLWFKFQLALSAGSLCVSFYLPGVSLDAGSLVFLHSGFVGQPAVSQEPGDPAVGLSGWALS